MNVKSCIIMYLAIYSNSLTINGRKKNSRVRFLAHPFSRRPRCAVGAALAPLALPPRQPVRARHPWLPGLPVPPRVACVGEFGSSHSVADGQLHRIARGMYIMQDRKPLNKKLTH